MMTLRSSFKSEQTGKGGLAYTVGEYLRPAFGACDTRSMYCGIIMSPVSQVKVTSGFFVPGPTWAGS